MTIWLPTALHDVSDVLWSRPVAIVIIALSALILRLIAKRSIYRLVHSSVLRLGRAGELLTRSEESPRQAQRADAIGGLFTSITTFVIGLVAIVMVLDTVGVNVLPLLTGAGIVGVIIAFGAQTIVKDFIAGAFMVLEDQLAVGDNVTVGDTRGTVEAVGLRVTRLRGENGTIWYVRNGEAVRVGNHTQGRTQGNTQGAS